jgi:hypothetical protein
MGDTNCSGRASCGVTQDQTVQVGTVTSAGQSARLRQPPLPPPASAVPAAATGGVPPPAAASAPPPLATSAPAPAPDCCPPALASFGPCDAPPSQPAIAIKSRASRGGEALSERWAVISAAADANCVPAPSLGNDVFSEHWRKLSVSTCAGKRLVAPFEKGVSCQGQRSFSKSPGFQLRSSAGSSGL